MRLLLVIFIVLILAGVIWFFQPGNNLVVDKPEKSDAIVVLGGDQVDLRYAHGLELLRAGYAKDLIVDVVPGQVYGHSVIDLAKDYLEKTAGPSADHVAVCIIHGDSTKEEAPQSVECLKHIQPAFHSGIVVTDDYHTRRALAIFRDREPQYQWTSAASHNAFYFGQPWWKNREWAKTYLTEVQKTIYWELWDRWRN